VHSVGTYRYDSLGRRVGKTSEIAGKTEHKHFLWQGLRMLREESPGQSSLYIYEPGSYAPLARVDQNEGAPEQKLYYFHTDQIGTPLEMTDADGQIVWQATYKAWGEVETLTVNEVEQNLRFQGLYFDEETGLHYNTFRYYDPEVGRFITQDPIGLEGGFNLYQYVPNPLMWVDPTGLVTYNTMPGIPGFQKHHIIPQQLSGHPVLKASGMNIHASNNVIYLPTHPANHPVRTVHLGPHPGYTAEVRGNLNEIDRVGREQGWTKEQYKAALDDVIVENRQGLRTGETKLNKNSIRTGAC
jgi:RHS repeat-associated protein